MRKITKRSAVVAGAAAVIIGGGAAAWAVNGWTIGGKGSAEAQAATITPLEASATIKDKIYPGLKTTITTSVKNLNDFPVQLTGKIQPTKVTTSPATPECEKGLLADDMIITNFPGTPVVEAKTTKPNIPSAVEFGDLPQACAGKTITVQYDFTAVSKA